MKTLRPYQQEALDVLKKRLKEVTHPLLVDASVGAGKSLIIAELLLWIERAGWRALCLTMNSTLIGQNAQTYRLQGGNCGIYCASLNQYSLEEPIIFASPHSILRNLNETPFNLIVIDECHNINHKDPKTMYMRILNHYGFLAQSNNYSFRVVGLTGTPYRGKSVSIVGDDEFFKEKVCEISTSWLIEQGYLAEPNFGIVKTNKYDYSSLKLNNMGKFNEKEIQGIVDKNERLTGEIMRDVQNIVESGRNGAFIFAATRKHCEECAQSLPPGQWAIITGETPHEERIRILDGAKKGIIRYLINVSCLTTGVDIPNYDVCAWLRPTESLVLYTQGIGRVLRLHSEKRNSLVLDYAGNLERHGDLDNPIINKALKEIAKNDPEYCIPCYDCNTLNKVTSRRCIGIIEEKRCNHYFEFVPCPRCETQNDIVSRHCRKCEFELIDPNKKLKKDIQLFEYEIQDIKYQLGHINKFQPWIKVFYKTLCNKIFEETFFTASQQQRNICYAKFLRVHCKKASEYYMKMNDGISLKKLVESGDLIHPVKVVGKWNEKNKFVIHRKIFD